MNVDLQPLAKHPGALAAYIDTNFRRLVDAISQLGLVEQDTFEVTGSVQIDTKIPVVKNAVASLASPPVGGGCFVECVPAGSSYPRDIIIQVYKNDFTLSVIPIEVSWIAVGEN